MSRPALAEAERRRLLAACRAAIAADAGPGETWLLAGSFGRDEDVWSCEAPPQPTELPQPDVAQPPLPYVPISDLDLVLVTPHLRTARPPGLAGLQAAYAGRNPHFRIDVKQLRPADLSGLAGTLFVHDLRHAPVLSGPVVDIPFRPPTMGTAYFLVANRYAGWLAAASTEALSGAADRFTTLTMRHRTCDVVLALLTAYLIRAGRYAPHLRDRVRRAPEVWRSEWVEHVREAYAHRVRTDLDGPAPGELWCRWSPAMYEVLTGLGPLERWPAEASSAEVQSVPPSPHRTPKSVKSGLQSSAILLAHCWSDPDLRTELDKRLPGWCRTWPKSRQRLLATWQSARSKGEASRKAVGGEP